MRVQHNIMAMNAYRNYSGNTSALSKNLEKLSSGYKINRAGDDAAGLAISEKMRAQISGLDQAQSNAKSGINLVQTAEGSLTEVHSMLNRMVTLADQSANGTYDNQTDRDNLQKEVSQLKSEINRIADSSNFNGIKLLDGSLGGKADIAGDVSLEATKATISSTTSAAFTAPGTAVPLAANDTFSYTVAWKDGDAEKSVTVSFKANSATEFESADGTKYSATAAGATAVDIDKAVFAELKKDSDLTGAFDVSLASDKLTYTSKKSGTEGAQITALGMTSSDTAHVTTTGGAIGAGATDVVVGKDVMQKLDLTKTSYLATGTTATAATIADATFEVGGKKFVFADSTADVDDLKNVPSDVNIIKLAADGTGYTAATAGANADNVAKEISRVTGKSFEAATAADAGAGIAANDILYKGTDTLKTSGQALTLQIGDTAEDFNQLSVTVGDMHTSALGIADLDISSQTGAKAAMDKIKSAINSVSSTRGNLGALQNRLDHTINNLGVMNENIQDAESTVRDTDVAKEMMAYTKNNILVQSAQAMLAQANQAPQGVLQLLQ